MKLRAILAMIVAAMAMLIGIQPTAAAPMPATAAGDCVQAGKVWLVVVTDTGSTLANECVGTPSSGTKALTNAGLNLTYNGLICTIGGYPAQCPKTFTGEYWQYYHAQPGGSWVYSTKGADLYQPKPGSLEGWCYGKSCKPPTVDTSVVPAATAQAPTAQAPTKAATTATKAATTATKAPTTTRTSVGGTSTRTSAGPATTGATEVAPLSPVASSPADSTPAVSSSDPSSSAFRSTQSADDSITTADSTPAATVPLARTASISGGSFLGVIVTGLVLAAAGGGYLLWRRTQRSE